MGNEEIVSVNMSTAYESAAHKMGSMSEKCSFIVSGQGAGSSIVSLSELDSLSQIPQMSHDKTQRIIDLIHTFVNKNDLLGIAVDSIENNVNAKYRLSYNRKMTKSQEKTLEKAKEIIRDFNKQINLSSVIAKSVGVTFLDGTYVQYLRGNSEEGYFVDNYPLTICEILPIEEGGRSLAQLNIDKLKSQSLAYWGGGKRFKKGASEAFEKKLQDGYPKEVYEAYLEKKKAALLECEKTGVTRINNQRMIYGLSPIFRAIYAVVMLDSFENSDKSTADARSKKILVQYLNKEIMGENYERARVEEQIYAHKTLTSAWKQRTVVLTPPPTVREIAYVEPKAELIPIETVQLYRGKIMTTLGISFLNDAGSKSLTAANISVKQLIKTINRITRQLEPIIEGWYKLVLKEHGISEHFVPRVSIADAEEMDFALRQELASLLHNTFNCSMETTLDLLGIDIEDEKNRRKKENEDGLDTIFKPYQSIYTNAGDNTENKGGRPQSNDDEDKQGYDKERNEEK